MTQAHIFYSGTVQGVGFRYTAQQIARELQVSGWVRNLNDGRVEILAEGQDEVVKQFLDNIEARFEGYIGKKEVAFSAPSGEAKDFCII